jgi:protocatechuate 3,4-dioxygenase beta subunit
MSNPPRESTERAPAERASGQHAAAEGAPGQRGSVERAPGRSVRKESAQPPLDWPDYVSTRLRHPHRPLLPLPGAMTELSAPVLGEDRVGRLDNDLTRQHAGEPLGQRIVVAGRLLDGDGRPIRGQLVEIWQANAAGRYVQKEDNWPAPLDPNFTGSGRCRTDDDGGYRFVSIRPGAYPWRNHHNAWRPAHIHFSVFGTAFVQRLVTQMYFPGDPLIPHDPIACSVSDPKVRDRMVSAFDLELTEPEWALGFRFDIVLGGPRPTPLDG